MYFDKPTIREVKNVLDPIEFIERPDGDNEGDPINSDTVQPLLSLADQRKVEATEIVHDYVRNYDGTPNRRAINTLIRHGFDTAFYASREDPYRHVGYVKSGDWILDISDAVPRSHDD